MKASKKKFWEFRAAAASEPKSGELLLYGPISDFTWWGDEITPKQFADDLKALGDIEQLDVYINSEGGDVWAGQAIHSQLKRHKARVVVHVDGLAASIASVIAMAGDEVIMPKNAMMMIHQPWTVVWGNAKELRKWADNLDQAAGTIIATYEEKSGLSHDEIVSLMDEETWMTAEEAKEKGFADTVQQEKKIAASVRDDVLVMNGREIEVGKFQHFPKDKFPPVEQVPPGDSGPDAKTQAQISKLRLRARAAQL